MRSRKLLRRSMAILVVAVSSIATRVDAQTEKVLYSFGDNAHDGAAPMTSLILDASGNLYGTASYGGPRNMGTVFELVPGVGGTWTEKTLHVFGNGVDGKHPRFGLVLDASGNLYGTTPYGGAFGGIELGMGMAFELTPQVNGEWSETVLHNFGSTSTDGQFPWSGFVQDAAGNLYGVTPQGGSLTGGKVYVLTPNADGARIKILYSSTNPSPGGNLVFDAAGNLYGVTAGLGKGTIYELSPKAGGGWIPKTLHTFNGADGWNPYAGLVVDSAGNLYGTTTNGGSVQSCQYGCGTVFELTRDAEGHWAEKVLHTFGEGADGANPFAGVILDAAGNLYGTTYTGGNGANCIAYLGQGCGIVYELSPAADGGWKEKILHTFSFDGVDGSTPYAGLIMDSAGNLYGTAEYGGSHGGGAVFKITP